MSELLSSKDLNLRPIEPEDLPFLYDCENDSNNWRVSHTLTPFSKYILRQYIENSGEDIYTAKQLRLIIEYKLTKQAIGAIDLFDFDPYHQRAGIGIIISDKTKQNKGYAFEALTLLIGYCFKHLNMHQLYCNIGSENEASLALFKKAGFLQIGIKTDWLKTEKGWADELMFQLIRN